MKKISCVLLALTMMIGTMLVRPTLVGAANNPACEGAILQVECDEEGGGIFAVLNLVLNILTVGVGIAATAGVIFAGLRYTQARDNAESMAGAKKMIINILIGLAVWAVFWALLQWLLPGGIIG